jgi:predicted nucleic acid-binding protein
VSIYFLDSIALVKRYAVETGTAWVSNLCNSANGDTVLIVSITIVEVAAALASKRRSQEITPEAYAQVMQDFIRDASVQYRVLGVDQNVVTLGVELTGRQKLRGYDAVQLAVALTINNALVGQQISPLTFISADRDLLTAANNEGLSTDDPNQYP